MLNSILSNDNVKLVITGLEVLETVLVKGRAIQDDESLERNPFLYDLESENMFPKIENLQHHASDKVYEKVSDIIDKYLNLNDVK